MKKSQRKKLLIDGYKEMAQETLKITREFEMLRSDEKDRQLTKNSFAENVAEFKKFRRQEKKAELFSSYLKRRKF